MDLNILMYAHVRNYPSDDVYGDEKSNKLPHINSS